MWSDVSSRPAAVGPAEGVHLLVSEWVYREPAACAVFDPSSGRALTYPELWRQAELLAGQLRGHGIGPGDLVAVALERSIELVVAFLGIVRAGAAYLPLDSQAPAQRTAATLEEAEVRVVVRGAAVGPGGGAAVGAGGGAAVGAWQHLPATICQVVVPTESTTAPITEPITEPTARATTAPSAGSGSPALPTVTGADPIYVAYTSGSTGRPKGVVVPHRAVRRLVVDPNYCTIAPGDRVANLANPAFDATTFEIWGTLTAGGTVVVFPAVTDLALDRWVELVRAERISTMFLTTSLFHMVARERPSAFGSLQTLVVGGEQLDLAAVRRVLAAGPPSRLVNGYGPTETTTFATFFDCNAESLAGLDRVPIGFALQNTRLYVLGTDLRPVPAGEPGELCVGGPGVATGYLRRPDLTAEKFVPEPASDGAPASTMYRTGDIVRQLPGGALELVGRRDRQVKLRGFRIELEEIERTAVATGLVEAAFVEKVGDGPAAALVGFALPVGPGSAQTAELVAELTRELGQRLPSYLLPARWIVVPAVPVGATGKVDRHALLRLVEYAPGCTGETSGPTEDAILAGLRQIWADVLGQPEVRATDNFIDLGGNSILAIQTASRARENLAVEVEPTDVLLAESLTDLAARIRATRATQPVLS